MHPIAKVMDADADGHNVVFKKYVAFYDWLNFYSVSSTVISSAEPGNMLGCCLVSFHFLWAILWPHTVNQNLKFLIKYASLLHGPWNMVLLLWILIICLYKATVLLSFVEEEA